MGKGEQVRARLIDAAVRLLADEGPQSLQARRLAREIGTSTMSVYHYFGGVPQLLRGVADDGFRRLTNRLDAVATTEDPVADLLRQALAYRGFARESPHLHDLMFGLSAPAAHPEPADGEAGWPAVAFGRLVGATERAITAERLDRAEAGDVAAQLWSALHGFVTLELADRFAHDDPLADVLVPLTANLLRGLGDEPDETCTSIGSAFS
ncbi:TetR/AcrR family transcriptional regulator [Saccharopolyspora sp. NPDC049357]|uniref:TetR/AcrR family transcriptional regulator n=1 Tax=Saccharopolyspora sp. NPDC049357 TaxID=3154507 RepID=UPI00342C7C2A